MRTEIHAAPRERFYEAAATTGLVQCVPLPLEPAKNFFLPDGKGRSFHDENSDNAHSKRDAYVIKTSLVEVFRPTIVKGINHVLLLRPTRHASHHPILSRKIDGGGAQLNVLFSL